MSGVWGGCPLLVGETLCPRAAVVMEVGVVVGVVVVVIILGVGRWVVKRLIRVTILFDVEVVLMEGLLSKSGLQMTSAVLLPAVFSPDLHSFHFRQGVLMRVLKYPCSHFEHSSDFSPNPISHLQVEESLSAGTNSPRH